MQTSRYGDESSTGTGGNESIDPNTGKVINAVSSITGVSMDLERGLVYENTEVPNQVYYGGKELVPKLRDGLQFNGDLFNAIDLTAKLDDEEAKRQKRLAKQMRAKEILRLKEARELAKQTGAVLTDDMSISSETSGREGEPSLQTFGIATAEVAAANVSIVRPTSGTNRRSDDASNKNKKSKELKKRLHQPEPGDFVFPSECNEYTEGFQNPELDMNGESVAPSVMAIAPSGKPLGSLGLKVNTEVKYHLGEEIFKSRFATLPCDDIIVAWAFIANHDELQARERDMALMWLNVWDDNSRHYKMLKKKGFNMATM